MNIMEASIGEKWSDWCVDFSMIGGWEGIFL